MIRARNLEGRVVLMGYISDPELKHLQRNARCLLAPLENDDQSRARMPTKIAEYLMTGVPVVTSAIGEISSYLFDRKNGGAGRLKDLDVLKNILPFLFETLYLY